MKPVWTLTPRQMTLTLHLKGQTGVVTSDDHCGGTDLLLAAVRCPPKPTLRPASIVQ
jgi:hypothetical protein